MYVVLAGGIGAARFLEGLGSVAPQEEITVVSNTGDDLELFGLHVSPDIDTVVYTMAGVVDTQRGWGLQDDTFHALEASGRFGEATWFNIGDRDLATHLYRTRLLRGGCTLSQATAKIVAAFGLRLRLLPMSDDSVRTRLSTDEGELDFQEYFVRRQTRPRVHAVHFSGAESAQPAEGVLEAIAAAQGIIVAPSNPLVSIGPILAIRDVRDALRATPAPVVAVSPIVGGGALKGPADRMLRELGLKSSAWQVAELYRDFLDCFIMDQVDAGLAPEVEALNVRVMVRDTIMKGMKEKEALARSTVAALERS